MSGPVLGRGLAGLERAAPAWSAASRKAQAAASVTDDAVMAIYPDGFDDGALKIGRHTYYHGEPFALYGPEAPIEVGAFCSIADESRILGSGEHAFDLPSTYPFRTKITRADEGEWDVFAKGLTRLGNDVWVGRRAMILSGSVIGDGAVIGAGAVVAGKAIAPYAIVAGNPGTIIGYRFDAPTIERLLAVRWWDWPDELIVELEPYFYSAVDVFLGEAERINAAVASAQRLRSAA
jgi:chloramphenicol O-acetyltransferase type B